MNKSGFVSAVLKALQNREKHNKLTLEKVARSFGIDDKNLVKELIELAIVTQARKLAHAQKPIHDRYLDIVDLYKNQVNLSHRTSQSVMLQQYSTPAPLGFIMGIFCGVDRLPGRFFEPSAGNGLLTIAADPERFSVNEIDPVRRANLETQGFSEVTGLDATQIIRKQKFQAVITNPPFGSLNNPVDLNGYDIGELDHLMAINALETLDANGRAAIIIGGHTSWDEYGRITRGKNRIFFNYLHKFFHVLDTIMIDGHALYSRQGTAFDTRLILIGGRKAVPDGVAPLKSDSDIVINTFEDLYSRVMRFVPTDNQQTTTSTTSYMKTKLQLKAKAVKAKMMLSQELGMPYIPAAQVCVTLDVDTPDSMGYEIHTALKRLKVIVGNLEDYVQRKLGYDTHEDLCNALSAEQTDAVALAIYNIEERGQALIVGDQTGIGKGRIAAAMVRYGRLSGMRPIFCTEKPNLFSDLYRDLKAIGSETLKPYIVNAKESKTHVKDEDGNVVYEALEKDAQKKIIESGNLPKEFDCVFLTYSQISGGEVNKRGELIAKSAKGSWLERIAEGNIIILDESHNASGDSNTGKTLQDIVRVAKGVTFLSATFAKRPDNMPIYAMKTAMSEANLSRNALVEGIQTGGVALQEVLSAQLVQHGQMIRRERSYEGIEVNYITLDDKATEHRAISDNITQIVRDIIAFQKQYIDKEVKALDQIAAKTNTGSSVEKRSGTQGAGVDSTPYFSKVFQVINQMLFSIKAEAVADRAIMRLKEGKKPVIAFSSTMGSFIESLVDSDGKSQAEDGTKINADFATVLQKGLDGVLRYSQRDETGKTKPAMFEVTDLSQEAQEEYHRIAAKIKEISSGILISPIDLIKQKLTNAGYRVAEVTGRKLEVQLRAAKDTEELPETRSKSKGEIAIPANAKLLIPPMQLKAVRLNMMGEEGQHFVDLVAEVDKLGKVLEKRSLDREYKDFANKNASIAHTFHKKVALPTLHYFNSSSDWYIYEWNKKEKLFYGFTILNGDYENAEFGSIGIDELFANYGWQQSVELDLYFSPQTLDQILGDRGLNGPSKPQRTIGIIKSRKKENTNDAFRKFQNNEVDVLMINQSGSTGASAHALPTKSVPANMVKQRVMILLQAELDINREVQKRGRINRTGQIFKPIYDYVFSAIPAEKRLMMMLQKKLKSLDANTTSNQKQSEAVLSVDDFLNKIGDRVVSNYLKDHPEVNRLLDDPLSLMASSADDGKQVVTEDAAHKVSGRVAVLPTEMQEKFYNTILKLYKDEVEYLKQIDEYDLEVDVLDLKATTLERKIKIVGKGGTSAFGDNTYIEKCEVNILRKPYTPVELENIYQQALAGKTPEQLRDELVSRFEYVAAENLVKERKATEEDYAEKIQTIDTERGYKALNSDAERLTYLERRTADLTQALQQKLAKDTEKANNRTAAMLQIFRFFTVGRKLYYPLDMENPTSQKSFAVALGVRVDLTNEKPFLPSNMRLPIAIASSKKRIDIPLSKVKDINAIMGISSDLFANYQFEEIKHQWASAIKASTSDRGIAYIITGNLLQSYGDSSFNRGRLISYTTSDGKTLKGRMMPDGWEPDEIEQGKNTVRVPIQKALKIIASLVGGKSITTDTGATIARTSDDNFRLMVASSKSQGGDTYLDPELNALMNTGRFDKVSTYMVANFDASKIKEVVAVLQKNHNASVELLPHQLDSIMSEIEADKGVTVVEVPAEVIREITARIDQRKNEVKAPDPVPQQNVNTLKLRLALKARAVKVKLKLAA